MQSMRRIPFFVLVLLVAIPGLVFADVFSPQPGDKSVEFLGKILGNRIGAVYLGGSASPVLFSMFEKFNAAIVCIGTIIVSYIGIVSTINTAQEGKTMGRKFASIWIPLRAILGMAVLVPAPTSGYSVIQVFVMWLILHGVGAADHIWNGILADLSRGLAPTRDLKYSDVDQDRLGVRGAILDFLDASAIDLSEAILNSATCVTSFRSIANKPDTVNSPPNSLAVQVGRKIKLYEGNVTQNIQPERVSISGSMFIGVPGDDKFSDVCGRYDIDATVSRDEWNEENRDQVSDRELQKHAQTIYKTKVMALKVMYDNSLALARKIVDEQVTPRDANNRLRNIDDVRIEPAGYRYMLIDIYVTEMLRLLRPEIIQERQDIVRQGQESGWISAGSFYFSFNRVNNPSFFNDITNPPRQRNIPVCISEAHCAGYLPDGHNQLNASIRDHLQYPDEKYYIAHRLWDANVYMDRDRRPNQIVPDPGQPGRDWMDLGQQNPNLEDNDDDRRRDARARSRRLQNNYIGQIKRMMQGAHENNNLGADADPLLAQAQFGGWMMYETERVFSADLEIQDYIRGVLPEDRDLIGDAERERLYELQQGGQFLLSMYSIFWVLGATMAVYIPLVPYMMFAIGVVGWFLLVIEAIVAAPILTLSFILPSGEELGKIMQGLMILLNILLRPTLMLFGFILAARLYGTVIEFVNFTLIGNLINLDTGGSRFAFVAIMALYGTFLVTLANKCFALIYALPDKVLRWMGGAPEHTDASQDLYQTKGGMSKGADGIQKVSSGWAERALDQARQHANQVIGNDNNDGGNNPNDQN